MSDKIELPEWDLVSHTCKLVKDASNPSGQLSIMWDVYRNIWQRCNACNDIYSTRKVFGAGDRDADVMIVGEGPGENEEVQLKPFVGMAGKILNNAFRVRGLTREDLYITNSVICRCTEVKEGGKLGNRFPTDEERGACRPRLEVEIGLVCPKMIIAMGESAWKTLTGRNDSIGSVVNKEFTIEYSSWNNIRQTATLIPTYHTAALLHSDGKNQEAVQQMKYAIGDTFLKVNEFIGKLTKSRIEEEATA